MPRSRSSENNEPFYLLFLGTDASVKNHVAKEFLFFKTCPFLNPLIFPVVDLLIAKDLKHEEIAALVQETSVSEEELP